MCHFRDLSKLIKNLKPMPGLLDTEEKVKEAYRSLEEATAEDFKKLDEAKRQSMLDARTMILD